MFVKERVGIIMTLPIAEQVWPELVATHELSSADYYFDSRAHYAAYDDMLSDAPSIGALRKAILQNKHLFAEKTVLVVGCGLSIAPLLSATVGASRVYAHTTYAIGQFTALAAATNGFENVELVQGDIRTVSLPVSSVDVIICEFQGCFLFYESKLEEMLVARDRFLKKDGLLFPDYAKMSAVGVFDGEERFERERKFKNMWGVDLTALQQASMREPLIDYVDEQNIVTEPAMVLELDLYKISAGFLTQEGMSPPSGEFSVRAPQNCSVGGLACWFEVQYRSGHVPVKFTTSPYAAATIWKQTILTLQKPVNLKASESLNVRLAIRNRKGREIDVKLSYSKNSIEKTEFFTLP